jgi:hypothetical protein
MLVLVKYFVICQNVLLYCFGFLFFHVNISYNAEILSMLEEIDRFDNSLNQLIHYPVRMIWIQ